VRGECHSRSSDHRYDRRFILAAGAAARNLTK
jgi:hypothetical protein